MARFSFRLDALPCDVTLLLVSFLSGFDLVRFSHVNRRLFKALLAPDAREWQRRVPKSAAYVDTIQTAKERYCRARSVAFPGRGLPKKLANERGGWVQLWSNGMPQCWLQGSFSFDLWFALHPGDKDPRMGVHYGGIIFGAQWSGWSIQNWWPGCHQQFVHVDTKGALYCSLLDTKTAVATDLQPQRWYHLALTFTRAPVDSIQRVYLDGQLVHEATGQLHSEARELTHGQLGSGCISGDSPGKPTEDFCGWYSFNGVLDVFRLWRGVLRADHVRRAAQGERPASTGYGDPVLSHEFHPGNMKVLGPVWRVRCTRPLERVFAELRDFHSTGGHA